jgi:hypothetical protein
VVPIVAVTLVAGGTLLTARITHRGPFASATPVTVWKCDLSVWAPCAGPPPRESRGPKQCHWDGFVLISYHGEAYARNPPSRLGGVRLDYDRRARLPADAMPTGWRSGSLRLWVSRADSRSTRQFADIYEHVYVTGGGHVERWPMFPFGCM